MKNLAIIAEYNPIHTGHIYQIKQAAKLTDSDCIIIIMSGDFVQRGVPAFADKYFRTKCALSCGADLVIELPAVYSCASAEIFAHGAVNILNQMSDIDYLSFGTEADDISGLSDAASILANEPEEYRFILKKHLADGFSMPLARQKALIEYTSNPEIERSISSPNNILAIEYLKALKKTNSSIKPVAIARKGSGYHDTEINEYPSATAVRQLLLSNPDEIKPLVNDEVFSLIKSENNISLPLCPDDLSLILNYKLRSSADELDKFHDVTPALAMRIRNVLSDGRIYNFEELIQKLKTKDLTYTRISRSLCHILLDLTKEDFKKKILNSYPAYCKVLGFNIKGREYLSSIKETASLPVITKTSKAINVLNPSQQFMLDKDILASDLYRSLIFSKYGTLKKDDFRQSPVIINS